MIQLSTASSTIPFSSSSVVKNFQKIVIENFGMRSFWVFGRFGYQILMDFLKIWYVGSRHGGSMTYIPVFQISKNFRFYKGFPKNIGFSKFWGSKILKFRDSHFVEHVILHLYRSFLRLALKFYFWRISKHWAYFGQNWREVTSQKRQFLKNFLTDFDKI